MSAVARALLLMALLCPGSGSAEVYRWTDADGRLHFAQSLAQVPEPYRAQARASVRPPSAEIQVYSSPARPAPAARTGRRGTLRIPFERQGALMRVDARINDRLDVPFFVDTGASGISLPQAAANALGLRVGPDTQRVLIRTANGVIREPIVRLDSVQLGGARVEGLRATISSSMGIGLLGASFFNNFVYGVDAAEGVITLRENQGIRGGADAEQWRSRFRSLKRSLGELEEYLETRDITRQGKRERLEQRREELREELARLDREATRAGVPAAWRE